MLPEHLLLSGTSSKFSAELSDVPSLFDCPQHLSLLLPAGTRPCRAVLLKDSVAADPGLQHPERNTQSLLSYANAGGAEMSGRMIVSLVTLLAAGCATVQDVRPQTPTAPTPTCKGVADCDAKWSAARKYLLDHAAYKLEIDSTDRLETFNPSNEATTGLRASVHREYEPDSSFAIVAKFWCNNLIVCSPDTKEALNDFNRAVAAATSSESGMQSAMSPPPVIIAMPPSPAVIDASSDRPSNGTTSVDAEAYIRESEAEWAESATQNDASVVRRILADDCVWIVGSTALDKAGAVSAAARGSANRVASHLDHSAVRLYGNVAVVQGSDTWTRKDGKTGHAVWTHTWIKRDGRWQIVAAQDMIEP